METHRSSRLRRSNQEWLEGLRPPPGEVMVAELRRILVQGLKGALAGRIHNDPDDVVEDFAQEALLKVLDSIESFRGESQFVTWAQKIAIRIAVVEMRRKRWQDLSLDELLDDEETGGTSVDAIADMGAQPDQMVTQQMLVQEVQQIIEQELTERQRETIEAFTLHLTHGVPLDELARRCNTNRNAFYKLLHDARKRLKKRLEARGISPEELQTIFS